MTLLSVDKQLKENHKSGGKTTQKSWFGFSQSPTPPTGGGGGFSDFANGMKTLSGIKFSDFVSISVAPLGLIAKKINGFYSILGKIDKKTTDNSKKNIEAFVSLMNYVDKQNPAKLWSKLKFFPAKEFDQFISDMIQFNKELKEFSKVGFTKKEQEAIKNSLTLYVEAKDSLEKFGLGDVIKMAFTKLALSSTASILTQVSKLGDDITKKYTPDYGKKLKTSTKVVNSFLKDLDSTLKTTSVTGALSVVLFPTALLGLASYYATIRLVGKLSENIEKTQKKTKAAKQAMNDMMLFIGGMTLLSLTIVGTGLLITKFGGAQALMFGLSVLAGSVVGIWALSQLVKRVGDTKSTKSSMEATRNIGMFVLSTSMLMFSIATVGIILTQVGGWKAVGLGVTMLGASMLGVFALTQLTKLVGDNAGAKKTKDSMMNIFGFVGASLLLSFGIIATGAMINALGGWKALGLGVTLMGASMLMIWGLTYLVKSVGNASKKALPSFTNILIFVGASLLLSVGVIGLGVLAEKAGGWKTVGMGAALVGAALVTIGGLAIVAKVTGSFAKQALLPMLGIIALGGLMELLAFGMVKLGKATQEAGGWKVIGTALGVVALTIAEMSVITIAIGALMMNPIMPVVMAAGIATLTGLGLAFLAITNAAKNMVALGRDVKTEEIAVAADTTKAFVAAMKDMVAGVGSISLRSIAKATAALVPIRGLIWNMSAFAKLLRDFAGEPGYFKVQTGTDDKGNPIYDTKGVHIESASLAIASGFSTFVAITIDAIKKSEAQTISLKAIRRINQIMSPVSKFAKILQSFTSDMSDPKNPKIRIARYDDNGKLVEGQVVDIPAIGFALGSGFGSFVETIFSHMDTVEANMVKKGTIKKINNLMSPVTSFVDIVSLFESADGNKLKKVIVDENGKITTTNEIDIIAIGNTIASTFDTFVSVVSNSLVSVEGISDDGAKKKIKALNSLTSGIKNFADELETSFSSDEELTKFKKNVDEINAALRNVGELYKSSLDETLATHMPKIRKNHHDFMNVLEKDTKSIKKPLQEYIKLLKEVNEQYNKLVPHVESLNRNAVTFVLDQGTKYETKIDDKAADALVESYEERIAPQIQESIRAAILSIKGQSNKVGEKITNFEFIEK